MENVKIYNSNCITQNELEDNSIDLFICDPPFGIGEKDFDKHYKRSKKTVTKSYEEAPDNYEKWNKQLIVKGFTISDEYEGGGLYFHNRKSKHELCIQTNDINIAGFHLGRIKEGDKAVAVVNIDLQPNSGTIQELREIAGVLNVSTIVL